MLTVRDIMQASVVTVTPETTVRQLSRLLADEEISGAPVVGRHGELLGVVSATDVVRLAAEDADIHVAGSSTPPSLSDHALIHEPDDQEEEDSDPYGFFLPEDSPFNREGFLEQFAETELDAVSVRDIMTPVAFSVRADATIRELADFLVRGRIHRAVVVNGDRLEGIVTSGDVLRAVSEGRLG
jgi:CBS domain-containing protein